MISKLQARFFLFIFGCIGSRSLFTLASYYSPAWILQILGFIALIPVIGWFYIIFIGSRDTGLEVFGDKIWWKNLRPIHMILWGFFSFLAINGNRSAWIVLLVDTVIGLTAFLCYHGMSGHFGKSFLIQ